MFRKKYKCKSAGGRRPRFSYFNRLEFGAICENVAREITKEALGSGIAENEAQSRAIKAAKTIYEKLKSEGLTTKEFVSFKKSYLEGSSIPPHYERLEHLFLEKTHEDGANMFVWRNNPPEDFNRKSILKIAHERIKNLSSYKGKPPSISYIEKCWTEFRKFKKNHL